ncbi:signal peptidase I [Metabacillus sp. GX 13764]|uniref:signal peptidase I n=1 Tax=Metabacillus kandeliae TaxID=2900151 RepID=UPI001E37E48D|nr:signal peptidase I [Metabacillus kandeliae]MCD7036076.1 signal peptidase I [Metabacillus kandeliae]
MAKKKSEAGSWIKSILLALVIVFIIRQFLFVPTVVEGVSMMPTLQDGNRVIVSKIGDLHRFDEIVFHAPDAPKDYVKRIIGLPGDSIEMKNDKLYINGKAVQEPYLDDSRKQLQPGELLTEDFTLDELTNKKVVPEGYLFVMGDNRPNSHDSRAIGFIKKDSVVGKVQARIWPLNELGSTKGF